MDTQELTEHLNEDHDFDAPEDLTAEFAAGVHTGLHVGEGRHGGESHLHTVYEAARPLMAGKQ